MKAPDVKFVLAPQYARPCVGAFHSTKNSQISGPKLNGTVKIPGKVFENLGIRFECTLFDGISGIIENFVFHSQKMSGLVSLPSVGDRTIRFHVCHTPGAERNSSICFSGKIAGVVFFKRNDSLLKVNEL